MKRFYRAATAELEFTHDDFPKADYSAALILKGEQTTSTFAAVADADEEKFTVTLTPAETAELAVGSYQAHFKYTATADAAVSFVPGCEVYFLPSPEEIGDQRTQAEKDLEAVEAAIRAKIEGGAVEAYTIETTVGKRNLTNMSLEDLRKHRRFIVSLVDRERVKAGKKPLSNNRWRKLKSHLGNQSPVSRRIYP